MLKAVIFDMDGVIVDSEPLHAESARRTVASFGVSLPIEYFYHFVGSTTKHMFETVIQEHGLAATAEELLRLDASNCQALYQEKGRTPVPGAIELIQDLASHQIKLAIASSSTPQQIQTVVEEFQIQPYFSNLVSGALLSKPKPAPDVFLEALRQLGVSSEEAVVIEDSTNGALAAKAASIACVGYLNPHSGNQDLYSATAVTDSLSALSCSYLSQVLNRFHQIPLTIRETPRLVLRELSLEDIPALFQICQKEEACRYIPPLSSLEEELEKQKAYIQKVYPFYGYGLWGVFCKKNGQLIGRAGIQSQTIDGRDELELSYLIDPAYWNRGYATEACRAILDFALRDLDSPRLAAAIAKENLPSVKVAEKLGMELEKEVFWQGFPCFLYGLDLESQRKQLHASEKALQSVKPDTNVYSKRYC